mgnify:CR=1 FL=1
MKSKQWFCEFFVMENTKYNNYPQSYPHYPQVEMVEIVDKLLRVGIHKCGCNL